MKERERKKNLIHSTTCTKNFLISVLDYHHDDNEAAVGSLPAANHSAQCFRMLQSFSLNGSWLYLLSWFILMRRWWCKSSAVKTSSHDNTKEQIFAHSFIEWKTSFLWLTQTLYIYLYLSTTTTNSLSICFLPLNGLEWEEVWEIAKESQVQVCCCCCRQCLFWCPFVCLAVRQSSSSWQMSQTQIQSVRVCLYPWQISKDQPSFPLIIASEFFWCYVTMRRTICSAGFFSKWFRAVYTNIVERRRELDIRPEQL